MYTHKWVNAICISNTMKCHFQQAETIKIVKDHNDKLIEIVEINDMTGLSWSSSENFNWHAENQQLF